MLVDKVEIGEAQPADIASIQQTARSSWHATYGAMFSTKFIDGFLQHAYGEASLRRAILNRSSTFLVARNGEQVVGFCHFGRGSKAEGQELYRLYVDPSVWRRGIGGRLVEEMEAALRRNGIGEYFCYVHAQNEVGKRFYLKQGFVHNAVLDEGDEWHMRKRLV